MDTIVENTPINNDNFFTYMMKLDENNKNELVNLIQYSVFAIIPVMVILKVVKYFSPEYDETKGSLEIIVESLLQITFIISAIWFANKAIRYFPTYSGVKYSDFDSISFIIPLLIIIMTMQSNLGSKVNILFDRTMELWNGEQNTTNQSQSQTNENIIPHQQNYDESQLLPNNPMMTSMPPMQPDSKPDFNNMYQNAMHSSTGQIESFKPMAANEVMGDNSGFSSW